MSPRDTDQVGIESECVAGALRQLLGPITLDPGTKIRTAASLPLQVPLVDAAERPVYQRVAANALQLRKLGPSDRLIAGRLGVTDKMVAKGIGWLTQVSSA
ncbi:MAG TPA: hypothetical protein VF190_01770 [Rhodothermales bacterium]